VFYWGLPPVTRTQDPAAAHRDLTVRGPFRTIQVHPKDLRALPGHPEAALSWHSGFGEEAMLDLSEAVCWNWWRLHPEGETNDDETHDRHT